LSDADRHEAAELLTSSFSDGRLSHEEFSGRLDEVYAARNDIELSRAFRGLPVAAPTVARVPVRRRRSFLRRTDRILAVCSPAGLCTVIWGMTTPGHYFWPEWVWLPTGLVFVGGYYASRRRRERERAWENGELGRMPRHLRRLQGTEPGRLPAPASAPLVGSTEETRAILSVVFVDIVGSTEAAASLGDRRWRDLLDDFMRMVDTGLQQHNGEKLFTKGDEVVATFRAPAQAIAYACGVRDAVRSLDVHVRAGIHTGEVEGQAGDMSGITLHIGQRVSAVAMADEIVVSSTVRDIAYGSGIGFNDHGEHELPGLKGTWHLYSVLGVATA
jgi:class 3 adenylate cyclase